MNEKLFTPIADRVVLKIEEKPTRTTGGVHLPDIDKEEGVLEGKIIAIGPGINTFGESYDRVKMQCELNDMVLIARNGAHKFEYEGEEYRIIREMDILTVINKKEGLDEK